MKIQKSVLLIFTFIFVLSICGCAVSPTDGDTTGADVAGGDLVSPSSAPDKGETENDPSFIQGAETYRGFTVDNVLRSEKGDIHFNLYIPDDYDGSTPYALYLTLPGYEGLYFQGVAQNLRSENFAFEAQKYNDRMIIVAPQLNDWAETSADQTIILVEYFLRHYAIDRSAVYANGYSGGGETMSIAVGKRPDLFSAYLQVSSQWDGEYESVVRSRLPVYLAIGENDEYYGSSPTRNAYNTFYRLYRESGLTDEEIDEILVLDIKDHSYFSDRNVPNEHGGGGLFAFDPEIMGWLFSSRPPRNTSTLMR